MRFALLICAVVLASGCAANRYCMDEQDYQKEDSVPALTGVQGLKLPESQTALRVPPPPAKSTPFGELVKDQDGDDRASCLDVPPAMPAPVEPKPAAPAS